MKKLLFIDACVRGEHSRTLRLARRLAAGCAGADVETETVELQALRLAPLDGDSLALRDDLQARGDFGHPIFALARQFAAADGVIVAAPFWDLSFPALLRVYLERLCVTGLTFHYTPDGIPIGDCRPEKLVLVTTRGGYTGAHGAPDHATAYLESLCALLGVNAFQCLAAEGLDIVGNDPEAILTQAMEEADKAAADFWS